MTPAARVQAAIEILDQVIAAARDNGAAADTLIARYFHDRRYAGSKDRRAVRELAYAAIRRAGERPESGRAAMLGLAGDQPDLCALFDGSAHGPAAILSTESSAAAGLAPAWLLKRLGHLDPADREMPLGRASMDLRVNRLKAGRESVVAAFPGATACPHAPDGVRLAEPIAIERHPLLLEGAIEVQDEGSQLIAEACGIKPGMVIIDLCAGAGGKALALASAMSDRGRIIACDTDRNRLSRLRPRAERAGTTIIETRLLNPGREVETLDDVMAAADVVLVDAPCSGTGTWRRNPEARWRLTPERLTRLAALQARLLDMAAELVRPGGHLVYAVCSLLREEGEAQTERFLDARQGAWQAGPLPFHAGIAAGHGRRLSPSVSGTDGFFVARLARTC